MKCPFCQNEMSEGTMLSGRVVQWRMVDPEKGKKQDYIDKLELKDDVLIRSNGNPTYFAADIAYHYNKLVTRGFDKAIDVWGADHHGHVARLKGAMDAVGLDGSKLDIVLMQLVRLMKDGEPYRMSKRTGKAITLSDLTDLVPIDAARFFFNMREPNSTLDFDLDLAVEESSSNPVYYVQYAHARICSLISNLAGEGEGVKAAADIDAALAKHKEMGCVCFENPAMGIYFIEDPDGYWIEVIPVRDR